MSVIGLATPAVGPGGSQARPIVAAPPADADGRRADVFLRLCRERLETDSDAAVELALRAIQRARAEGNDRVGAQAMLLLAQASHRAGHSPAELLSPVLVAVDRLTAVDEQLPLAEARLLLSRLYLEMCVLDDSAAQAQLALNLAIRCGERVLEAQSALALATALAEASDYDGVPPLVRQHFEQAVDRFLGHGDTESAARSLASMSLMSLGNGDPRETLRVTQRMLELLEPPAGVLHVNAYLIRAVASARLRWPGVAEQELATAETMARKITLSAGTQLSMLYARGSVFACTGRFADARSEFTTAAARSEQLQDLIRAADCYEQLASVCEMDSDFVGALAAARSSHEAYVKARGRERDRRLQALEIANRLAEERERSKELAKSQSQLEHDVDEARQELGRAERQLEWERSRRALVEMRSSRSAGIEVLTGLPDLPAMSGRINEMLDCHEKLAVVVITVDDDRVIAPLPDVRRRLVQEIAARTLAFMRVYPGSFAGSLGSEDIVAVIPVEEEPEAFHESLTVLHHALSEPMDLIDVRAVASVQFGVAIAPGHGIRPNALLSRARLAAQAARSNRPSGPVVAYFEESVEARQMLRTFVRERLPSALEAGDVDVHFQPVIDMATGEATSAEALVRWTDAERGPIPPGVFIPLAEETELIVELGGFVLRRACVDAVSWPVGRSGLPLSVSVNVSAAQLVGGILVDQVETALALSGLPAHRLAVELTETTLARADQASSTLSRLRERGVKVEIDDFGTGYSSFSYLTNFPIDAVKIDKSFVDRIAANVDDAAITQAIIQMAHSLRLTVIAEGIELPGQVEVLRQQGCDALQGYLFAKPMSTADLAGWLRRQVMAVEHASSLA